MADQPEAALTLLPRQVRADAQWPWVENHFALTLDKTKPSRVHKPLFAAEFQNILADAGENLVVIDFYATWYAFV